MVDLKKLVENKQIITKEDLFDIMVDNILLSELGTDIEQITMCDGYKSYGLYVKYLKKINVNYDKLVSSLLKLNNSDNILNIININYSIIATALHEIQHANQYKIIRNQSMDKIICDSLSTSFSKTKDKLYLTNHDDYIVEYNASLDAHFKTTNLFLDSNLSEYANFTRSIYNILYSAYFAKQIQCERLAPLEKFNFLVGNDNYKEIKKYDYSNIDSIDKILFGLPLKKEELKKILKLEREKNTNMYNYFDESKRRAL